MMTMPRGLRAPTTLLTALLLLAPTATRAQDPLPEAGALLERYLEAVGGRQAILDAATGRATGTFEVPAAGLKGHLEVFTLAPNRMLTRIEVPGIGVIRSGFTGEVGWSMDPMTGARLLEGAELTAMREQANTLGSVRDASVVESMETVERTEIGGQPCYRVRVTWKSGRESFDCYHVDSGLMVATSGKQETPMGTIEVLTRMEDYKAFGDVMTATRIVQEMMGMQQVMTVTDMTRGGVEPSMVEPPPEIQALIKARG